MTNILPQVAQMNRGAWLLTEEIVEFRDIDELLVIGGVIWGNNPADDYFILSHGVKTPDAFWKVRDPRQRRCHRLDRAEFKGSNKSQAGQLRTKHRFPGDVKGGWGSGFAGS